MLSGKFFSDLAPDKFINVVRLLHDDTEIRLLSNEFTTDPFTVKTGVNQGCVIAPVLFSIFLAALLRLTAGKLPVGVQVTYHYISKLKAKTQDSRKIITRFYYVYMLCNLYIKKGIEELEIPQLFKLVIIVAMKESGNIEWIEITNVIIVTNDKIRMGFR